MLESLIYKQIMYIIKSNYLKKYTQIFDIL